MLAVILSSRHLQRPTHASEFPISSSCIRDGMQLGSNTHEWCLHLVTVPGYLTGGS